MRRGPTGVRACLLKKREDNFRTPLVLQRTSVNDVRERRSGDDKMLIPELK